MKVDEYIGSDEIVDEIFSTIYLDSNCTIVLSDNVFFHLIMSLKYI